MLSLQNSYFRFFCVYLPENQKSNGYQQEQQKQHVEMTEGTRFSARFGRFKFIGCGQCLVVYNVMILAPVFICYNKNYTVLCIG